MKGLERKLNNGVLVARKAYPSTLNRRFDSLWFSWKGQYFTLVRSGGFETLNGAVAFCVYWDGKKAWASKRVYRDWKEVPDCIMPVNAIRAAVKRADYFFRMKSSL